MTLSQANMRPGGRSFLKDSRELKSHRHLDGLDAHILHSDKLVCNDFFFFFFSEIAEEPSVRECVCSVSRAAAG